MKERMQALLCGSVVAVLFLELSIRLLGALYDSPRPETGSRKAGYRMILCTGDSFTYGWGMNPGEDFPAQLETILNASGGKFQVVNAGRCASNSRMLLESLEPALRKYRPEFVTVMTGGANVHNPKGMQPEQSVRGWVMNFLSLHCRTFRLAVMLKRQAAELLDPLSLPLNLRVAWERGLYSIMGRESLPSAAPLTGKRGCDIDLPRRQGRIWDLVRSRKISSLEACDGKRLDTEELFALGFAYIMRGELDTAERHFDKVSAVRGKHPLFFVGSGYSRLLRGSALTASEAFREALTMDPGNTAAMLGLGCAGLILKGPESDGVWLTRVREIDPGNGLACHFLGLHLIECRNPSAARELFLEGIRCEPELSLNYSALGELCLHSGQMEEARVWLNKALERGVAMDWEMSRIRQNLGMIACLSHEEGCLKQAQEHFLAAVRLNQRNFSALSSLGVSASDWVEYRGFIDTLEASGHREAAGWLRSRNENGNFQYLKVADWLAADLTRIAALCREYGAEPIFLNYPLFENPVLRKKAAELKLRFVDVCSEFSRLSGSGGNRWDYFLPDMHCNTRGNQVIAGLVALEIRSIPAQETEFSDTSRTIEASLEIQNFSENNH
ncbi:MAG: hypothetical protein PHW04_00175 [Candidatus Wallbacteria bacterium]|nr:hypothetical protein [Candidatus Wallbacteria bacterium]